MAQTARSNTMPTHTQVCIFFGNFGLQEGKETTLTFKQYKLVIQTALRWHGTMMAQYVADCFMPEGEEIEAGYEDSKTRYVFQYP